MKAKKEAGAAAATEAAAEAAEPETPKEEKKSKKEKKRKADDTTETSETPTAAPAETPAETSEPAPKRKKAKKSKSGGVDSSVFQEAGLSEPAKKAIFYAQLYAAQQAGAQDVWKFNKARQGWLLRNYFEGVPEKYVPVVAGYLKTVVGGGRKTLEEKAREYVDAPVPKAAEEAKEGEEKGEGEGEGKGEGGEKEGESDKKDGEETKEEKVDPEVIETRRTRARLLLDAM